MEIEFKEVGDVTKGSELYERRCDWLDRQVSKVVLGQTATTDAAPGSHAIGGTHRLVQEDLERADAMLLSATLTRQLVPRIVDLNYGPQERYPKIIIGRPDELPIGAFVDALAKLGPLGLEVEESQVLARLGVTEKAESVNGKPVRVVGGRTPAPQILPGLPGGPALEKPPAGELTRHLVSLHAAAPEPEYVDRLTARLARDMEGAMAGLTGDIRALIEEVMASGGDLKELQSAMDRLQLDPTQYAEAMQRGMVLAHLVGQAALVDELRGEA